MTVRRLPDGNIALEGDCASEDAEQLLQELLATPAAVVDWRTCKSAHAAVIQVLMAARSNLLGPPASRSLMEWIQPILVHEPR